jgi:hypothetical protein
VLRRPHLAALTTAGLLLVTGCTATVPVPAAPHAADPVCAEVVLALPRDLEGLERLRTDSQATVAWGDPSAPVVLRCGVEPPGPTTDQCVTADDGAASVDWVTRTGPEQPDGSADWTFVTYGRSPAVEVHVPAAVTAARSTSFLVELGPAVARVDATRSCV